MKILNFEDFMQKHNLRNDTMNEFELPRVFLLSYIPQRF